MNRLTAVTCAVILLMKLKGFDCANTTLLILPPKYESTPCDCSYGGLSPSEIALLSAKDLKSPTAPLSTIVLLLKALPTSPFLLSFLPPQTVSNALDEIASSPCLLNSIDPPDVVCLINTLCVSPLLLKFAPPTIVSKFVTEIVLCPKIVRELPPPTTVSLLGKIGGAGTSTVLCSLSPAVRASLVRSVLSPKVLGTLKPAEVAVLVNVLASSAGCSVLAESLPTDLLELLKTIALSPAFANSISASQMADLLSQISKAAPALFSDLQPNVLDVLLTSVIATSGQRSSATLVKLLTTFTSPPFPLSTVNSTVVSSLLKALSPPGVLRTVPSTVLIQLLIDLSLSTELLTSVAAEAIVSLLSGIKSTSPGVMSKIPPCVLSAYATHLTSPEVTDTLPIKTAVELIGVLCKTPSFLTGLSASQVNRTIEFVTSDNALLNATPPSDIVDFVHTLTDSSCVLREISPESVKKLLSLTDSISSLRALDSGHLSKLFSSISSFPYLITVLSADKLINILAAITSVPVALKETPNSVYVNVLTQIFTTPDFMAKVPLPVLLDLMKQIEDQTSDAAFCAIPPCAISTFADFLGTDAAALASLPPAELINLVDLLAKVPCILTQLSVNTLDILLNSIVASLFAVPAENKIKLIVAIQSLSPSVLLSLPPESIGKIANSLGSFYALDDLDPASLVKLISAISTSPCLLSALDLETVIDLLNFLSTSPSTLSALESSAELLISISANDLLLSSVPVGCFVRFLRALHAVLPSTSCPVSTAVSLLKSLISPNLVDELTSADVENLVDLLTEDPCLLTGLPPVVFFNLLTTVLNEFTAIPRAKIVHLLATAHSASPSLLYAVTEDVLVGLLETIDTPSVVGDLTPETLAAYFTAMSTSPRLLNATPAAALDSLLGLLSSSPAILATAASQIALTDFFTNLALSPTALQSVKVSTIVSLLAASGPTTVCAMSPMAMYTLLTPLSDAKIVYDLQPAVVASLLRVLAASPCALDAVACFALNTIAIKVSSSPRLIQHLSPELLVSFLGAVAYSRPALDALRPSSVTILLTSIAEAQPRALSTLSPAAASALLLGKFNSEQAFASLPPPILNDLLTVLDSFPNLFAALPLSVLDALLRSFTSSPAVLGAVLSSTIIRFLSVLSSMQPVLRALSPSTLVAFYEALAIASPKLLCAFPAPIVTALFDAVLAEPALAALTPSTVASLLSTLNTSPCLIVTLPSPLLVALITQLSANPGLLSSTPRTTLLGFIENVRGHESISRANISANVAVAVQCGKACSTTVHGFSFVEPQTPSTVNVTASAEVDQKLKLILPENVEGTPTVYTFPKSTNTTNA